MVPAANLLAFAVAATVIVVVPGPGVLFTIGRALVLGRRAALVSVLGHCVGVLVALVVVSVGLGTLLTASAVALTLVKILGAGYLIHLGIQAIRERKSLREALGGEVAAFADARVFRQSFVVGITNPKAIVFFAAVLPHFADPASGPLPVQFLILGTVFLAIALVSDSAWALLAAAARSWFARSPRRLEAIGGTGGAMIVGLGASVALSGTSR
ncbi:LysE family translocator [Nocardia cyriacigeorgica]|uniref:Homoserine/homoserine lactone efflux protein n=1 Tax=Nocardia cyriacigeorgica TaxID=135487 RepID=A0A4U8W4Q6_9NOCA|nr:LysE family translocator [Nocardia cyriacigeorgica]MBF6319454.1 LysE family translocator [Nocardia cyriacigeorgica]MBF6343536.1 LysE family translocator [Nocardia cyriacigeorgica]MBF6533762.1 LysE family translocator [Nocardia cyriacigeorgica]VFB01151.1 Homoserine/homoserine lactone efflux protein [Nocardia cyriacigeorgica]